MNPEAKPSFKDKAAEKFQTARRWAFGFDVGAIGLTATITALNPLHGAAVMGALATEVVLKNAEQAIEFAKHTKDNAFRGSSNREAGLAAA